MPQPSDTIRIYSPHFPVPVSEGAFQVVFDQTRCLAALGMDVELVVWKDSELDVIERRKMAGGACGEPIPASVRVTCLDADRTRSSKRTPGAGESFPRRARRVVRSLTSELASSEEFYYPSRLADRWKRIRRPVRWAIYHSSFCYAWLRRAPWRPGSGPPGPEGEQNRAVVFHNLESDLFVDRRERALARRSPTAWIHDLNSKKLKRHETALAALASELWFISPEDQRHFLLRNPEAANTRLISPTYSAALRKARLDAFRPGSAREHAVLGFLGGMHFLPNRQSAEWIVERLAPKLAARSFQGTLRIVGRGAPPELQEKASRFPFIKVEGFLPDLEEFWASLSHSLVPHLAGSGVRTKLLEALVSGVPTLATPGAVARIHPGLREHPLLFCSEDPEEWAERIMGSDPFRERRNHAGEPMPGVLEGERVYRFLS